MNLFERILFLLQKEMECPKSYGWYHFLWIGIIIISVVCLYLVRNKYNEKQLKIILGSYGIIVLILEVLKQIVWSFNYDPITQNIWWDYNWYAAPFQFCTTPIYVSLICLFLKKSNIRDSLLSYLAYFTILGSLATIIMPDSCFTSTILVNIHTMYLHCGSFILSIYLLITKEVKLDFNIFLKGFIIFIIFVFIANSLNIILYNLNVINGETFNMFYISPYFVSELPIYNIIQQNIPYFFYLIFYIVSIFIGGLLVYFITKIIIKSCNKDIK